MRSIWGFWLWLVGVKKQALATSKKGMEELARVER